MDVDNVVDMLAEEVFPERYVRASTWKERWPVLTGLFVKYYDILQITSNVQGTDVAIDVTLNNFQMSRWFDLLQPNAPDEMQKFFRQCLRKARLILIWRASQIPKIARFLSKVAIVLADVMIYTVTRE
jgi:hypothetical protein